MSIASRTRPLARLASPELHQDRFSSVDDEHGIVGRDHPEAPRLDLEAGRLEPFVGALQAAAATTPDDSECRRYGSRLT